MFIDERLFSTFRSSRFPVDNTFEFRGRKNFPRNVNEVMWHYWPMELQFEGKIKYWSGIRYLKKFKYGLSRSELGPRKTLPENTFASLAKWSIDTKVWNMCLQQRQIFHGHGIFQHFYHVTSFKSISIVFETGKHHSWPIPYPFGEQKPALPGRIQVSVPALSLWEYR